jgi:ribosomal protein S18 acetylase RimI-like enzyme
MEHFVIAIAESTDCDEISNLVNSAYRGDHSRHGWTTEADLLDGSRTDATAIANLIKRQGTTILKYSVDNKITGVVELDIQGEELYLGMLTVEPDTQGKGIGKVMMTAAEEFAKSKNCKKVFMTVITERKELIAWYGRRGYHDTGQRKPFNFTDPRFGTPKKNLEFAVLEKSLIPMQPDL